MLSTYLFVATTLNFLPLTQCRPAADPAEQSTTTTPALALANLITPNVDPDFDYQYSSGSTLLPELSCYMTAITSMASEALLEISDPADPESVDYAGVQLTYGGDPIARRVPRELLMLGFHASVFRMGESRRFVSSTYHLRLLKQRRGTLVFLEERAVGEQVNETALGLGLAGTGDGEGSVGSEQVSALLQQGKRRASETEPDLVFRSLDPVDGQARPPVQFHWAFRGAILTHTEFFAIIAHMLLQLAPQSASNPARRLSVSVGDVDCLLFPQTPRGRGVATLIWADAINMLFTVARAAVETGKFMEVQVVTGMKTQGQDIDLGVLSIKKQR